MEEWSDNWEETEGEHKLPKPMLTELRNALLERCKATGVTLSPYVFEIEQYRLIPSSWFTHFQDAITTLFSLYRNHTSGDGLYSEEWTESTIIEAIGDTERIQSPHSAIIIASWCWQQKRLLNKLRYTSLPNSGWIGEYKGGDGDSWSEAVSDYQSTAWTPNSAYGYDTSSWHQDSSGTYFVNNKRGHNELATTYNHATPELQSNIHMFSKCVTTQLVPGDNFYSPDGYQQNQWYQLGETGWQSGGNIVLPMFEMSMASAPPFDSGHGCAFYTAGAQIIYADWDFNYKDWE